MGRIVEDPRHTAISVVYDRSILRRGFGSWSMVFLDGGKQSMENIAHLVGFALGEKKSPAARRLRDILLACDAD